MPVTRGYRVNVYADFPDSPDSQVSSPVSSQMELQPLAQREIIDITCGVLTAKLHKERFICPGINRECIEFEGQFITPKSFYVVADKGSLKDWKNAIRINGKKMRVYIDSGELDFYNHTELCTGRCKSRVGKNTLSTTSSLSMSTTSSPASSLKLTPTMLLGRMQARSTEAADRFNVSNDSLTEMSDCFDDMKDVKPSVAQLNHMMMLNLQPGARKNDENSADSAAYSQQLAAISEGLKQDGDEDVMFWRAIVQLGLIDEFFREIKAKMDVLKVSMIKENVPVIDARKATFIVNELGMKAKLDLKLCAHKYEFDRQRQKLENEMEQLKKKVSEYEQKKEVLKRKSDCYEALMTKKLKEEQSPNISNKIKEETKEAGHADLVNGEGGGDADNREGGDDENSEKPEDSEPLVKDKTSSESGFTIETASGKVLIVRDEMPTLSPTLSPAMSSSQGAVSREDTPELESSELSSQASSLVG